MTHTPPCPSILGRQSLGFWSLQPAGHLVVFVHGFNGAPQTTWDRFPFGLLQKTESAGVDLLFYGYDSLRQGAEESGVELYHAIDRLWKSPATFVNASQYQYAVRPPAFRFTRLTLVAHSLGAAVARQAVIEHHRNGDPWTAAIQLVLFAPAHKGANGAKLGAALFANLPFLGGLIGGLLQLRYQSIRDLDPDSPFLKTLLSESEKALVFAARPAEYVKARSVVWAISDPVVTNQRFLEDPTAERVPARTHSGLCKPVDGYDIPVDHVLKALR